MTNADKMLEEYKAEEARHKKAISDIMRKYNPNYDVEVDRVYGKGILEKAGCD